MFQLICPPAFFTYFLSNSGALTELRTTSLSNPRGRSLWFRKHNRIQVLSIPVLLLACCQDWTCNPQMIVSLEAYETNADSRYAMCFAGQLRINFWDFNVLTSLWLLLLWLIFLPELIFRFFYVTFLIISSHPCSVLATNTLRKGSLFLFFLHRELNSW